VRPNELYFAKNGRRSPVVRQTFPTLLIISLPVWQTTIMNVWISVLMSDIHGEIVDMVVMTCNGQPTVVWSMTLFKNVDLYTSRRWGPWVHLIRTAKPPVAPFGEVLPLSYNKAETRV
jgi:hypothetical protein